MAVTDPHLPRELLAILSRYREASLEAYIVGGSLRDHLLGKAPTDYDIATAATPEQTAALFPSHKVIPTGVKHGTVTLLYGDRSYEITTFRTEGGYSDARHPDRVCFTNSIEKDLSRRDFTVNAIAYSPINNRWVDPFNGRGDLDKRLLRAVGDPTRRFEEDPLRILRGVRFLCRLGFTCDDATAEAMLSLSGRLKSVSAERISSELLGCLTGDHLVPVFARFAPVIFAILPELYPTYRYDQRNPRHDFPLYTHLCRTAAALPENDPILRLTGLLHDIGKPLTFTVDTDGVAHYPRHAQTSASLADELLLRLRFPTFDRQRIVTLIHYHDGVIEESEKAVRRRLQKLGRERFFDLLLLQEADRASQKEKTAPSSSIPRLREIAEEILQAPPCFSVTDLAVDGHDMMSLGYKGKEIGAALSYLLDAVIDGNCENEKTQLLSYLLRGFTPPRENRGTNG